jgi:hypothetical protein
MKIKTRQKIKLELFNPVKIKLLKKLSEIEPDYLDYPDEDKEVGSIMELDYTPSGIYLEQSGKVFLSDEDNKITLIEGVDFEFI